MNNQTIYNIDYTKALPQALKEDKDMLALGKAIAGTLLESALLIERNIIYANIDRLDEDVLDILAYDFHVDWYDYNYPIDIKRAVIKDSVKVHKYLGTKYAVETAVRNVFPGTIVKEWFEYGGSPYTFRLVIDSYLGTLLSENYKEIKKSIRHYVNLRSHLDQLIFIFKYLFTNCYYMNFISLNVKVSFINSLLIGGIKLKSISFNCFFNGLCIWPVYLNGVKLLNGTWLGYVGK